MAGYRLTEPAQADLLANDGASAAERVLTDLEASIRALIEHPRKGHTREDLTDESDLRFWPVHAYLIVYRPDSNPLEILRIVHGSRDVERELMPPP